MSAQTKNHSKEIQTEAFNRFIEVIAKLRDPNGGCPWDLEQTHDSLRPYVVEETYELLDAITVGDDSELCKELGDLLLQVVLHAQVAKDRGAFSITEVLQAITEKMINRHPHVFGATKVAGTAEVLKNWEQLKKAEREQGSSQAVSVLDGVPRTMPALHRAQRLGDKAAKANFDWSSVVGVLAKVDEEVAELKEALNRPGGPKDLKRKKEIEHELGDTLFSLTQLARWSGLNAEDALQSASARFIQRFSEMERSLGDKLSTLSEEQLEAAWQQAKKTTAKLSS